MLIINMEKDGKKFSTHFNIRHAMLIINELLQKVDIIVI